MGKAHAPDLAAREAAIRATYRDALVAAERHNATTVGRAEHDYQKAVEQAQRDRDGALAALHADKGAQGAVEDPGA